jgi:hypothetical protein
LPTVIAAAAQISLPRRRRLASAAVVLGTFVPSNGPESRKLNPVGKSPGIRQENSWQAEYPLQACDPASG